MRETRERERDRYSVREVGLGQVSRVAIYGVGSEEEEAKEKLEAKEKRKAKKDKSKAKKKRKDEEGEDGEEDSTPLERAEYRLRLAGPDRSPTCAFVEFLDQAGADKALSNALQASTSRAKHIL